MAEDQGPLKVFMGNLPHDGTAADIDTILMSVGLALEEIRLFDVHMVRDRETDAFKGFAYITVSNKDQLDKVMGVDGSEFDGRHLKVDNKTGRGGGRGGMRGGRGGDRGGRGRGGDRGGRGGGFGGDWNTRESGSRGGHHFGGQGGYVKNENDFEVVRGRGGHRGGGGGGRGGYQHERPERHDAPIVAGSDEGRPRLALAKKTTDPAEIAAKKRAEEEAERARKEKIFGH